MPRTILRCFLTNTIIEEFKIFFFFIKLLYWDVRANLNLFTKINTSGFGQQNLFKYKLISILIFCIIDWSKNVLKSKHLNEESTIKNYWQTKHLSCKLFSI